ncbi:TonB-dependent receptor [Flavobacterium sp. ARAG 55.4]|uniref:TonB-dependent receptor n=1 Tax=Flavobacterium sp. ARAG 55.4 TaxID=3451357 RepID=UPI003F46CD42
MKRKLQVLIIGISCLSGSLYAQEKNKLTAKDSITVEEKSKKDVTTTRNGDERNVMLNAANNNGPREVNIGLPPSVGGITILENDLPVVYFFWPELTNKAWRPSVSLQKTGLLKMEDLATKMGDLGFAVNSYSQNGTKEFKVKAKLSGSHFGWMQGDVNISGPMTKNGWSYSVGAFANFDPNTYDSGFNKYADQTQIYRAGLTKFFKNNKGQFNVFYRFSKSYTLTNYAVFEYGNGGKASELDDFTIGRDSYIVRDGKLRLRNALNGDYYWADLDGKNSTNKAHNIDIFGNYLLNNGWNFKYSTRLHLAKASIASTIPLNIFQTSNSSNYTIASTGESHSGNVGTMLATISPEIPTTTIMGRFELAKKIKNHDITFGLLEQYFKVKDFHSDRSFFYQTVENQPQRLIAPNTDEFGFFNYNVGAEYYTGNENKLSAYGTDNWQVNDKLKLNYGLNLRWHNMQSEYNQGVRTAGMVFDPAQKASFNDNWIHIGGSVNASYNIGKDYGLLANFLYTEENGKLNDFSTAFTPNFKKSKSPLGALGVFWNNKYVSLVSQATYLTKNNYLRRYNLVNPQNSNENQNASVYYDIQTIGWTTDIVAKPFKGFNLHYLITLQDPVYKNFKFSAFGNDYDYSDNNVLEISKVLMEIDPSYSYNKWKLWASFRYFSKQYANLTNALFFQPRWETFGGLNYKYNDHLNFGATFINFLNQRGAKGTINGAELITEPSAYYGKLLTGSYILPFTAQLSVNINF